jgi:hypothetical protein
MQTQEQVLNRVANGRSPMIAALTQLPDFDLRLDDVFEPGLRLLVDPLAGVNRRPSHACVIAVGQKLPDLTGESSRDRVCSTENVVLCRLGATASPFVRRVPTMTHSR